MLLFSGCWGQKKNSAPVSTYGIPLTQKYYDTDGRMGSSWQVQDTPSCPFSVGTDNNGTLLLLYPEGCKVDGYGRGIRLVPKKRR